MAYEKKTIISVIEEIEAKKIYLPAIQRKYVWGEDQITRLMDSIMRGYPFGTFLFWKVKKRIVNGKGYSMYEFIKDYHERDRFRNEPAGQPFTIAAGNEDETILSALDGQQRLTSLYIALKGSISMKLPKKHWDNDAAFPKKELYFNLRSNTDLDNDIIYEFEFLTSEEANEPNTEKLWYKVKDIVQYPSLVELNSYIRNSPWGSEDISANNITLLFTRFKTDEIINYFEVESESIDDVLDIFVRVNSGGTVLSKTDLLFSTIVSYWDAGREEIDNLLKTINNIGDHYSFSNDFIMRTCLYLMDDLPITLKVETFGQENVGKIESEWKNIKAAIKDTIEIMQELGFNAENIVADNAVIPLIYYRYKYGQHAFDDEREQGTKKVLVDEKMEIRKYMVISQIRHIFGQSTNSTLTTIRRELKKHVNEKFKFAFLQDISFSGGRSLRYDENDIDDWFDTYEKNAYTFMLLSLLYPNYKYGQKGFHQDHMHPYSAFENDDELYSLKLPMGIGTMDSNKIETWRHLRNTLANLQILEGRENESKNDEPLEKWLENPANKESVKYLPVNIDYSLANFDEFLKIRKDLMFAELKRILL